MCDERDELGAPRRAAPKLVRLAQRRRVVAQVPCGRAGARRDPDDQLPLGGLEAAGAQQRQRADPVAVRDERRAQAVAIAPAFGGQDDLLPVLVDAQLGAVERHRRAQLVRQRAERFGGIERGAERVGAAVGDVAFDRRLQPHRSSRRASAQRACSASSSSSPAA